MPQDEGLFTLDTDASGESIGAVLSQEQNGTERVIAYASKSLDKRERNYCVTRKELLAVVYFLRHFKQYLLGRQIRVQTDHAALTWLRKTPEPIGQQARWLEIMEEFDFTVEHRPGVRHTNADAMSRRPCPKKDCFCSQQVSVCSSADGPGKLNTIQSSTCSRETKPTSRVKESLRERPPALTLNGPAGLPPTRPVSVEAKPEVSSQGDGALLSRSTRNVCQSQGGDGPRDGSPTQHLNGPADRPRIDRRRRKYRRSQAPNVETIMEGDEASYRRACDDVELFNFAESQEVEGDQDLIDFSDGCVSCRVVNEERDVMDFSDVEVSDQETCREVSEDNELNELSQDEMKSSGLNPLAEDYQPRHHPESMGGGRCRNHGRTTLR